MAMLAACHVGSAGNQEEVGAVGLEDHLATIGNQWFPDADSMNEIWMNMPFFLGEVFVVEAFGLEEQLGIFLI